MRVRVGTPRSLAPSVAQVSFLPSSSSILPKEEESTCDVRPPAIQGEGANAMEGNHIGTWMDGQINERFLWRLHGWDVGFLWMISDEAEGGAC